MTKFQLQFQLQLRDSQLQLQLHSGKSLEYQHQLQLQLRRFQLQFQLQLLSWSQPCQIHECPYFKTRVTTSVPTDSECTVNYQMSASKYTRKMLNFLWKSWIDKKDVGPNNLSKLVRRHTSLIYEVGSLFLSGHTSALFVLLVSISYTCDYYC